MGTRTRAAADEALIEAHFAGRLAREQVEAILDRVTEDGRRVRDIPDDEVWADDSPLSELEALIWERHEGAKPENIEARLRKLAEFNAHAPEPELPIVAQVTFADDDLGASGKLEGRRTPSGQVMQSYEVTTTRALSESERAELDRRARHRLACALAAASGERASRRRPSPMAPRPRQRPRGAGRPRAAATRSSSSSTRASSSSGDGGDSDPPAEPASAGRSPSLAPASRLTLREARRDYVRQLHRHFGVYATVSILRRLGWPVSARAQALTDAGIAQGPDPAPDRGRWLAAQVVQRLHDLGCEPVEIAWRRGSVQAQCPSCRRRYPGRRLIVAPGPREAELTCAIGCTADLIRLALNGGTA